MPPYVAGDIIPDTEDLDLQQSELTVLIGTASTCQYCAQSMPFYARLQEVAIQHGARVVAYTREDIQANRMFFEEHGLSLDLVVSATRNGIELTATPTLVLTRRDGTVVDAWLGTLSPQEEERLLETIRSIRRG